jgi:hypothetical protein
MFDLVGMARTLLLEHRTCREILACATMLNNVEQA